MALTVGRHQGLGVLTEANFEPVEHSGIRIDAAGMDVRIAMLAELKKSRAVRSLVPFLANVLAILARIIEFIVSVGTVSNGVRLIPLPLRVRTSRPVRKASRYGGTARGFPLEERSVRINPAGRSSSRGSYPE
ncbi:protein of unknown function [Nitrospira japonica]|uniref:Uncharacterized protein n=1 Tax=Nitrospira japonica TaxID=1325564 RepID=A0A1W1I0Z3_9BACT|nr:protein of unknown function [Nitrospira japonica]